MLVRDPKVGHGAVLIGAFNNFNNALTRQVCKLGTNLGHDFRIRKVIVGPEALPVENRSSRTVSQLVAC